MASPIRRAMLKNPALRFENAGELRGALRDARKGTPFDLSRSLRLVPSPLAEPHPPAPVRVTTPKPPPPPVVTQADPSPEPPAPLSALAPRLRLWFFGLAALAVVLTTFLGYLVLGYLLLIRPWFRPAPPPRPVPSSKRTAPASPIPRPSPTNDAIPPPEGDASPAGR